MFTPLEICGKDPICQNIFEMVVSTTKTNASSMDSTSVFRCCKLFVLVSFPSFVRVGLGFSASVVFFPLKPGRSRPEIPARLHVQNARFALDDAPS